jgi:putative ABC transport system permease protein
MTILGLIRKNLFRRKLRTGLLLVTIAVVFLLLSVLASFKFAFDVDSRAADTRLLTFNRISYSEKLPIAYAAQIAALPGVRDVGYSNLLLGFYRTRANPVAIYAIDPNVFLTQHAEDVLVGEKERAAFAADRAGVLVGSGVAQRYGLHVGDPLPLSLAGVVRSDGAPSWRFQVDGIYRGAGRIEPIALYIHDEYFDEARVLDRGTVDMIWVRTKPGVPPDQVANAIDARFRNALAETRTTTESEFARAFVAQFGNVAVIIAAIALAAAATVLLIVTNTVMISFRERIREIAVLKALGFTNGKLYRLIFGETLLLSALGGIAGVAAGALMISALGQSSNALFQRMTLGPVIPALAVLAIFLLGFLGGAFPATRIASVDPARVLARE